MAKEDKWKIVSAGLALSAILLFTFGLSKNFDLKYLHLQQAWFFVSAVPIILALFIAGYIRKGSIAGFEFEASSEKMADLIIPATTDVVVAASNLGKRSLNDLKRLTIDQRRSIRLLKFEQKRAGRYKEQIIFEYFEALLNLEYFQIERQDNPNQYLSVDALRSLCSPRQGRHPSAQLMNDGIERPSTTDRFLSALKNDRILQDFGRFSSELKVNEDQNLEEILGKMYSEKVEFAAVFSTNQTFVGIIEARSIEKKISKSFLKWKK